MLRRSPSGPAGRCRWGETLLFHGPGAHDRVRVGHGERLVREHLGVVSDCQGTGRGLQIATPPASAGMPALAVLTRARGSPRPAAAASGHLSVGPRSRSRSRTSMGPGPVRRSTPYVAIREPLNGRTGRCLRLYDRTGHLRMSGGTRPSATWATRLDVATCDAQPGLTVMGRQVSRKRPSARSRTRNC